MPPFCCYSSTYDIVNVIAALYVLCALIRLAYFNVLEEDRQKETDEAREKYLGIPVTTIAIILPAMYIFYLYKIQHIR